MLGESSFVSVLSYCAWLFLAFCVSLRGGHDGSLGVALLMKENLGRREMMRNEVSTARHYDALQLHETDRKGSIQYSHHVRQRNQP